MKVAGCIFQEKFIHENSEETFDAKYKKRNFYITADHGHGKPEYDYLTRYDITVKHENGMYDVNTYEDCHSMRDAIIIALKGACFLPTY